MELGPRQVPLGARAVAPLERAVGHEVRDRRALLEDADHAPQRALPLVALLARQRIERIGVAGAAAQLDELGLAVRSGPSLHAGAAARPPPEQA
jgi:hypothetical protein